MRLHVLLLLLLGALGVGLLWLLGPVGDPAPEAAAGAESASADVVTTSHPPGTAALQRSGVDAPGALHDGHTSPLAPGTRLVGVVFAPDGSVRAGARVALERADGLLRARERRELATLLIADEEGRFTISGVPPGAYRLRADSAGCGGAVLEPLLLGASVEEVPVELRLTPGAPVTGRVRDPDGRALADARVLSWTAGPDAAAPSAEEIAQRGTPVQPDGRFTLFGDRGPGVRTVVSAAAPGHVAAQLPLAAAGDALEFVLAPCVVVRGRVFAAGAPAPEAELRLRSAAGPSRVATSDPEGRFAFDGVTPGVYQLWAASSAGSCELLPLIVSADLAELRLDLADAPGVAVFVSDPDGAPLAGARVTLAPDDLWEQGFAAEWEWSEQSFTTEAAVVEGEQAASAAPAVAAAAPDAAARDALPRERPARVVLMPRSGRTGADGRVRFADVPEGVWQVQAEREGFRMATDLVDLDVRGTRELVLALQPAGTLRVLLADERGAPIAGAPVQLLWRPQVDGEEEGAAMQSQVTDDAGQATWRDLAADDYLLRAALGAPSGAHGPAAGERASAAGSAPAGSELSVALAPGETREVVLTVRGAALASAVVSCGGAPAPYARVALIEGLLSERETEALRFAPLADGAAIADGAGLARLPAVAPGAYTLVAQRDASSPARCAEVQLRAGLQEIRIQLPVGSVGGSVHGAAGPLAGATVLLLPREARRPIPELDRLAAGERHAGAESPESRLARALDENGCMTLTDAAGRFRFEAVPPGNYRVQIHAPPYAPLELPPFPCDGAEACDLGDLRLDGAGALAGSLTDSGARAWVQLDGPSGETRFVPTAADGRWLCDRLTPGAWTVRAWSARSAASPVPAQVRAGALLEIAVPPR